MKNLDENLKMSVCKAIIKGTNLELVDGKSGYYFRSGKNKKLDSLATMACKIYGEKGKRMR